MFGEGIDVHANLSGANAFFFLRCFGRICVHSVGLRVILWLAGIALIEGSLGESVLRGSRSKATAAVRVPQR